MNHYAKLFNGVISAVLFCFLWVFCGCVCVTVVSASASQQGKRVKLYKFWSRTAQQQQYIASIPLVTLMLQEVEHM